METLLVAVVGTGLLVSVAFALGFRGRASIKTAADVGEALAAMPRRAVPVAVAIGVGGDHALSRASDGRLIAVVAQGDTIAAHEVKPSAIERFSGGAWVRGDLGHPDFALFTTQEALDAILLPHEAEAP